MINTTKQGVTFLKQTGANDLVNQSTQRPLWEGATWTRTQTWEAPQLPLAQRPPRSMETRWTCTQGWGRGEAGSPQALSGAL